MIKRDKRKKWGGGYAARPHQFLLLFFIAPLFFSLSACQFKGGNSRQSAIENNRLRVAINSDILGTDPGVRRDGNTDMVIYHIVEALVAPGEDMRPVPMLAKDISISADGLHYDFTLRDNVRFHNGEKMTAEHVLWSWRRLLNPKTQFRCLDDFNGESPTGLKITNIAALNNYKIRFTLNKPSALFLDRMANVQCITAILHPDSVDKNGDWIKPIGTGLYQFIQHQPGDHITLKRYDGYQSREDTPNGLAGRKTACLSELVFKVIGDRVAARSALYAGNIDLVFAIPPAIVKDAERRAENIGDIKVFHHDTQDWTVLLMQSRDPLLSDVRMRRAIAMALSANAITEISTFDMAKANHSAVPLASSFARPYHQKWWPYDSEQARALAKAAGYKGEELVIQSNSRFSYMADNAVTIQAMLKNAGINSRIILFDWTTHLDKFVRGDFQISSFGYSARAHPALIFANIIGDKDKRASAQWDSPAALQLLRQTENVQNDDDMQHIIDRLVVLMRKEVPLISLNNDRISDITAQELHGYAPWLLGRPRLWNIGWTQQGAEQANNHKKDGELCPA